MSKKGFALALTLWIVAMMSLVTVIFLSYGKKIVKNSRNLETKLEVTLASESFLEFLKFYASTAKITNNKMINYNLKELYPLFPTVLFIDSRKNIWKKKIFYLQDTAGLINITDTEAISSFVNHENRVKDKKVIIKESIEDWLDKDSIAHLNGAESNFYKNYNTRDKSYFAHSQELSLIRGITDSNQTNVDKLLSKVYLFKRSSRNLLTMNINLLVYIYEFSQSNLIQLKKARAESIESFERIFFNLSNKKFNVERDSFMPSGAVIIKIVVTDKNVTKEICSMVDFMATEKRAWEVWDYKDGRR
jgi:hypothetical protein